MTKYRSPKGLDVFIGGGHGGRREGGWCVKWKWVGGESWSGRLGPLPEFSPSRIRRVAFED
jgi:hypothetical protein